MIRAFTSSSAPTPDSSHPGTCRTRPDPRLPCWSWTFHLSPQRSCSPRSSQQHRTTEAVILVKPQFEAGRGNVGKGGIVRDPEVHKFTIGRVSSSITELGWEVVEVIPSPITGAEGNVNFSFMQADQDLVSP